MLRSLLLVAAIAAASLAATQQTAAGTTKLDRPNVLIIHVDQLRFDCLGVAGNADLKTPHIDRLAIDGVRFTNSFCAFPICTPSRYSLLSGRYVHDHRGWDNASTLSPKIDTFPKMFRAAGYHTKAVGKMHFTPPYLDVGFDEMLLAEQNGDGRWLDDYHRYLMRLGLVDRNDFVDQVNEYRRQIASREYLDTFGAMPSNLDESHYSTTWIGDRAAETIRSWNQKENYLLMVGFIKPHHPFDPPVPWDKLYDPAKLTLLPGWTPTNSKHDLNIWRGFFPNDELTEARLRRIMAYYYATISEIDQQVGRLVALLKEKGLYAKTLIVFTGDHGEYMGFHHMVLKGNEMYDPLVKVPLVIKWPGERQAGVVSQRIVSNIDLAPTLCRAAGLAPDVAMKGEDLGNNEAGREIVFCEAGRNHAMARTKSRKLIVFDGAPKKNLFYDLQADPLELNNLYDSPQAQEEIRRLAAAIAAWRPKPIATRYEDPQAAQIHGPNVPPPNFDVEAVKKYYRAKMGIR